jgi:AbrB family looped-hinge helix DNA binding protein
MRITSKGQVTIPLEIRERVGLAPGMEVDFEVDGDDVRLRRTTNSKTRGELIVEQMRRHPGSGTMTTDEIMALTRGED